MTDRSTTNRRRARKATPGYQHRLLATAPELAAMPGVMHATVQHDDACAIFQRQACNCVPDISIVPETGGSEVLIDEHGQAHRTNRQ